MIHPRSLHRWRWITHILLFLKPFPSHLRLDSLLFINLSSPKYSRQSVNITLIFFSLCYSLFRVGRALLFEWANSLRGLASNYQQWEGKTVWYYESGRFCGWVRRRRKEAVVLPEFAPRRISGGWRRCRVLLGVWGAGRRLLRRSR